MNPEFVNEIQWESWRFFYADERLVKLDNKDSNHAELQKHLISKLKGSDEILKKHVFTLNENLINNPLEAAKDYQTKILKELNGSMQFDLILLGMGPGIIR